MKWPEIVAKAQGVKEMAIYEQIKNGFALIYVFVSYFLTSKLFEGIAKIHGMNSYFSIPLFDLQYIAL